MIALKDPAVLAARRVLDLAIDHVTEAERAYYAAVVRASPSHVAAAEALGISPRQLARRLATFDLKARELRAG